MIDNGKLSLWDVFNNLSIGLIVFIIIFVSVCYYFNFDYFKIFELVSKFSAVLVVIVPILFLCLGMIVDAFSNRFSRYQCLILRIENKFSREKSELKAKVRQVTPEKVSEKLMYRYCKAYVSQNCKNNNIEVFLARFGFYRNISFIFFLTSVVIAFYTQVIIFSLLLLMLSRILMNRSLHFLSLMESEVYYGYLSARLS